MCFPPVIRVGCMRYLVTNIPDEWLSKQNPAYRLSDIFFKKIFLSTLPSSLTYYYTFVYHPSRKKNLFEKAFMRVSMGRIFFILRGYKKTPSFWAGRSFYCSTFLVIFFLAIPCSFCVISKYDFLTQ